MDFYTHIDIPASPFKITRGSRTVILGSCFADEIGSRMQHCGLNVCVNPFGTLYNPVSVANAASRLSSAVPFCKAECVQMGAGEGLWCSFSHHTSFARNTQEAFLTDANRSLEEAARFWKDADTVIVTLGTALCYVHKGEVVANCLKRDGKEFSRLFLGVEQTVSVLTAALKANPEKRFIFTVSPIRHLGNGAHTNALSKSTLLLAEEDICRRFEGQCVYFPSFEIMMDELRDYRFYAEDMAHPSAQAADYIWERFAAFCIPESENEYMKDCRRAWKASLHRPLH